LIRFLFVLCVLLLIASPSLAKSACYSNVEAEAEQGIRIHSELMVIGLNCQHMGVRAGMNLYGDYRAFTTRHGKLFAAYENTLMEFFKKKGDAKPVASLNTLRTNVANKISDDAASMRPDVFCSKYAMRITKASSMSQTDVRKWAATIYPEYPVSYPLCK
jgi:hypothetical protein